MTWRIEAAICFSLVSLGCLFLNTIRVEQRLAGAVPHNFGQQLLNKADAQATSAIADIDDRLGQITDAVTRDKTGLIARADARTGEILNLTGKLPGLLDLHASRIEGIINTQLSQTNHALADNMAPIGSLAARYALLPDEIHSDREFQGLIAQTMGTLGAAKITMGQTALTMQQIQKATPDFLAEWRGISQHISLMTQASAGASTEAQAFLGNLAAETKPYPKWLRYTLGIAPPLAQTGAAMASAGVAVGWIRP